jgi:uncharacterized protein (TIGR02118 family)
MFRETSTCFVTRRIVGGRLTAMIKLVFCLRRRADLTREEFQRYWRDTHGPLVRERGAVLGLRRYVQVHTLPAGASAVLAGSRGVEEAEYDGVAELWWDSVEALGAASATPEGRRAGAELLEDERRFLDLARSPIFLAEEHTVLDAPATGEVTDRLGAAMNAHDLDAFVDVFSARYRSEQPAHPARSFEGADQVRQNWASVFAGVPDLTAELRAAATTDDGIELGEWDWHGTFVDGSEFAMRGVTVLGVESGRISWGRLYMEPVESGGADIDEMVRETYRPPDH